MHRAVLNGLKMVGHKLSAKEEEAYRNKGTHKPRSPRRHNSPRHRSRSHRSRTPSPGRYNSPKNEGTRQSRTSNRAYDYKDDEKEMGAPCFTHRAITPTEHMTTPSRQYPKVLNYPMTNKSTTDLRSHSHGFQTIYKQ
jgi:hypothetical protein